MASFPLCCIVCPKEPSFSDISHLLTHIASKGHLSHYFKAQVRSRQDEKTKQRLQAYDQWYSQNDIEDLLSHRLMQKDSKRGPARMITTSKAQPPKPKRVTRVKENAKRLETPSSTDSDALIDPMLSRLGGSSGSQSLAPRAREKDSATVARRANMVHKRERTSFEEDDSPFAPTETVGPYPVVAQSRVLSEMNNVYSYRNDDEAGYQAEISPQSPLRSSYDLRRSSRSSYDCLTPRRSPVSSTVAATFDDDYENDDRINEASRLKGIIWPGMDLFDSASPNAKRKRNQRKETSVLEVMQVNSEKIEPTEVIRYYPSWDLKMERFISGEVESSPLRDEEPSEPRRPKTRRAALSSLDPNAPLPGKRQRTRKSNQMATNGERRNKGMKQKGLGHSNDDLMNQHLHKRTRTMTAEDQGLEWRLPMGDLDHGQSTRFKVFDERVPHEQTSRIQSTSQGYTERDNPFLGYPYAIYGRAPTRTPVASGSWTDHPGKSTPHGLPIVFGTHQPSEKIGRDNFTSRMPSGKEDIEPIFDQFGRIDHDLGHFPRSRNRQNSFRMSNEPGRSYADLFLAKEHCSIPNFAGTIDSRLDSNPLAHHQSMGDSHFNHNHALKDMQRGWDQEIGHAHEASGSPQTSMKLESGHSSGDETVDLGIDDYSDYFGN